MDLFPWKWGCACRGTGLAGAASWEAAWVPLMLPAFMGSPKIAPWRQVVSRGHNWLEKGGGLVPLVKMGLVRIMSRLDTAFRIITPSPQPELLLMSHHKNTSLGATSTSPEHLQGRRLHIPVPDHPLHEEILPNAQPKPSLEQ